MKKVFLVVCFVAVVTNVFAQRKLSGEKGISSIGAFAGYVIESETPLVGVDFRYNILDRLRLAPSVMYAFEKNNYDIMYINADAHYLARITPNITLYPIGGIGLSFLRYRPLEELLVDETDRHVGVNLGFGGEMRVTKDLIGGVEFRYNWTKQYYNQAMIMARIAYYF